MDKPVTAPELECSYLGEVSYPLALEKQLQLLEQRKNQEISDQLIFLEHSPVYTMGRHPDKSSLNKTDQPNKLEYPVIETNRGGQATFHNTGQLVGYPIIDLTLYGKDLHALLRLIESAIIQSLKHWNLPASRSEGMTGVWIEDRKIASIGVGVKHWISMHGFAVNICNDLRGFEAITPCGIEEVEMTSLSKELQIEVSISEYLPIIESAMRQSLVEQFHSVAD